MKGYWNRPEETREVLSEDGWLATGDIAIMEDTGYIRLVDRKKDMIFWYRVLTFTRMKLKMWWLPYLV